MGGNYFETSEYRIMEINLCGVDIPLPDGKYAINVSGGADSALLLYILMTYTQHDVIISTMADDQLDLINTIAASRVVNKVVELTGNFNVEHSITYVQQYNHRQSLIDDENIKVYYAGITSNPPDDISIGFSDEYIGAGETLGLGESDRSPNVVRDIWVRGGDVCIPFFNVDKKKIAEIYDYLGITEALLPMTVSCTVNTDDTHCGECWWCEERKWAFGRLV